MYPIESKVEFEATLKSEDGTILETGKALVELEDKFVVFKNSFVPLYPVGTPMEIVRVYYGKEIHRFKGLVYLSDKTIMKLTDVEDELMKGSEICYGDKITFEAKLETGILRTFRTKRFFKTKEETKNEDLSVKIKITEMSPDKIVFQITNRKVARLMENNPVDKNEDNRLEIGTKCTIISDEFGTFKSLKAIVRKPLEFGENPKYVCDIVSSKESAQDIQDFLWDYNVKHNKLF